MNLIAQSTIRRAQAADAELLAALFQLAYGESSHPCQDAEYVRRYVTNERNIYFVDVCDGAVVAGMGITDHRWHDGCEWGLGITHPSHRCAGLAEALMQKACATLCARRQGDVLYGYPRVRRIYEIGLKHIKPSSIAVGHDGGINVANGLREYHLLIFARLPHAHFTHVTPRVGEIIHSPLVREHIFEPLGLAMSPGEYPALSFVGLTRETALEDGAPFDYSYDHHSPSGALTIHHYRGTQTNAHHLCQELDDFLEHFPAAQHISADILADKTELLLELRKLGFEVTAYLPAWYKQGDARYDCLRVVKRRFHGEPVNYGLADELRFFQTEFARFLRGEQGGAA